MSTDPTPRTPAGTPRLRTLGDKPDLEQLKRQAKELLEGFRSGDADAATTVSAFYRGADRATFALHDAQLVLARGFGFESWPKFKAAIDGVTVRRLAEAVRRGDLDQVQKMLDARPELVNLDMAENDEHRAIHFAVMDRSPEMVRMLMQRGADARKGIYPHRRATTALVIANERGYEEIVSIILEGEQDRREKLSGSGVEVTAAQDDLSMAIAAGDNDRALAMLAANPDSVNAFNREGYAPLHVAAAVLNEPVVAWLIDHGADVNLRDTRGQTPLDLAADMLLSDSPEGFAPVAKLLREHGAALTPRSAVALGDADWLQARHAAGTLVNDIDPSKGGLLNVAVRHDRKDMLQLLLDVGFDPDERVRIEGFEEVMYTQTFPLHSAATDGKLEMAEMLLKHGATPNEHVYASGSPVYRAFHNPAMLALLKSYGGVVDPVSAGLFGARDEARRILELEAQGKFPKAVLEGRNASEDLLRGAADGGDVEIVKMALPGVDWPRQDDRWYWIMMQAIWGPHPECLRLILERCDPTMPHRRVDRTILHDVAALGGEATAARAPELAAMLIDAGARLDVRDDLLLSTPLGWACRWGRAGLVKLLLERGADPVEADAEPWATPRAWAKKANNQEILALLEQYGG